MHARVHALDDESSRSHADRDGPIPSVRRRTHARPLGWAIARRSTSRSYTCRERGPRTHVQPHFPRPRPQCRQNSTALSADRPPRLDIVKCRELIPDPLMWERKREEEKERAPRVRIARLAPNVHDRARDSHRRPCACV